MSSLESPSSTLTSLSSSLKDLTRVLQPLLSSNQPLDELVSKLEQGSSTVAESSTNGLEGRLDAAKLQVSIAYILLDLVWFHLKLTGQDPSTHPVHAELERVRSYFGKIKCVQSSAPSASSSSYNASNTTMGVAPGQVGRMRIDQAAAGRFVKNAIGGNGEKGKHTKFDTAAEGEKEGTKGNTVDEEMKLSSSTSSPAIERKRKEKSSSSSSTSPPREGSSTKVEMAGKKKLKRDKKKKNNKAK